jgi:hypothetical protein
MPVDTTTLFAEVIQDHLSLKQRNSSLEGDLPLERYMTEDPFENHPLFKTEEQARLEETMDGQESFTVDAWPVAEEPAEVEPHELVEVGESLWTRSRDFDWGD